MPANQAAGLNGSRPLFWDQYDNAQRIDETGHGVRLDTYRFTAAQMDAALERVLGSDDIPERAAEAGRRARGRNGVRRAADLIEDVGRVRQA